MVMKFLNQLNCEFVVPEFDIGPGEQDRKCAQFLSAHFSFRSRSSLILYFLLSSIVGSTFQASEHFIE